MQPQLAFSENNLRFEYSATAYRNPSATQYQYRLHGFNSAWSDWTDQTFREYTNLHEGEYRFEVRARTVTGTITEAASYGFVVAPPWYRTWGAYVLYGIFGAGALVLYGHFRSLQSRRKLEKERLVTERLTEANEELRKANQMKDEFLANISHELRTPLTSILGFADILAEEVDDSQAEFLELIKASGSRLHDTLDAILDLAKFRAGMVDLDLSPVDVAKETSDAAHLFHPQADEKGLDFTVDVPEEPIMAEIDEFCLERIVNNLLSNAIKFTDEGSVTVVVTACEDEIVLAVRDTGEGIEEEFQPLLFDEFRQESVGDDREHAGVGLGLAITKRMVDLLGGSIQVESEKGVGTTFTVHLPREADPNTEPEAVTGEVERTSDRSNGQDENGVTNADRPIYQVERETHIRFG